VFPERRATLTADLVLPRDGIAIRTGPRGRAVVQLRRFARSFPTAGRYYPEDGYWFWLKRTYQPGWEVEGARFLSAPLGSSSKPWIARITAVTPVTVC
jgi:hypothetical protein